MEKKLRILIVEDGKDNIKSAKAMLSEHDVTVVSGYDQARRMLSGSYDIEDLYAEMKKRGFPPHQRAYNEKYGVDFWKDKSDRRKEWDKVHDEISESLKPKPFDVLLTDVKVPKGGTDMLSTEAIATLDIHEPVPYGAYIAFFAIQRGLKLIGIITSGNHHEDPFVYALDGLNGFTAGDLKVVMTNSGDTDVLTSDYKTGAPEDWDERQEMIESGKAISVKNWSELLNKVLGKKEDEDED